jgi:hypothetical protein
MDQFRIVAIRTPTSCIVEGRDFLKILAPETIFPFYSFYTFPSQNFETVKQNQDSPLDLYSWRKDLPVNISAVVGANGSGKSTLTELFIMASYNIGAFLKMLTECTCDEDDKNCDCKAAVNKRLLRSKTEFNLEILFSTPNKGLIRLCFDKGKITRNYYSKSGKLHRAKAATLLKKSELEELCYTITVNYSHHALNSKEIGDWIVHLFHKNDGYQTPIVINPMRNLGIIDINRENELLNDRLLSNLLMPLENGDLENSLRNMGNNKIATHFYFDLNEEKIAKNYLDPEELNGRNEKEKIQLLIETRKKQIDQLFAKESSRTLREIKNRFGVDFNNLDLQDEMVQWACLYVLNKAYRIRHYPQYLITRDGFNFKQMRTDQSHIAFKFKRAIYFLKYYHLWKPLFASGAPISIDTTLDCILQILGKETNEDYTPQLIELLPPSFLNIDIIINEIQHFSSLSSGERQKIHSVSSLVYHVINLNSIKSFSLPSGNFHLKYKNINIILDEIELYFHPNWQRNFIFDLLEYLKKVNSEYLKTLTGLNFIFVTHSPFILSDIPKQNILKLAVDEKTKRSKPYPIEKPTFGANIHELLSDSFFLDSTIGEVSRQKFSEIIDFHYKVKTAKPADLQSVKEEYKKAQELFWFVVQNTGEQFIKGLLENHLEFIEDILKTEKKYNKNEQH